MPRIALAMVDLARPALADQPMYFAGGDGERHAAQNRPVAVAQRNRAERFDREPGLGHRRSTGSRLRAKPSPS